MDVLFVNPDNISPITGISSLATFVGELEQKPLLINHLSFKKIFNFYTKSGIFNISNIH